MPWRAFPTVMHGEDYPIWIRTESITAFQRRTEYGGGTDIWVNGDSSAFVTKLTVLEVLAILSEADDESTSATGSGNRNCCPSMVESS